MICCRVAFVSLQNSALETRVEFKQLAHDRKAVLFIIVKDKIGISDIYKLYVVPFERDIGSLREFKGKECLETFDRTQGWTY